MKQTIRNKLKENRDRDTLNQIENITADLTKEGYEITFGTIGEKTTYVLLKRGDEEILGYTFIKDLRFKNEATGKLKALQQAITRKSMLEQEEANRNNQQ